MTNVVRGATNARTMRKTSSRGGKGQASTRPVSGRNNNQKSDSVGSSTLIVVVDTSTGQKPRAKSMQTEITRSNSGGVGVKQKGISSRSKNETVSSTLEDLEIEIGIVPERRSAAANALNKYIPSK